MSRPKRASTVKLSLLRGWPPLAARASALAVARRRLYSMVPLHLPRHMAVDLVLRTLMDSIVQG